MKKFSGLSKESEIQEVQPKEIEEITEQSQSSPRTMQHVMTSILELLAKKHQQSIYQQLLEMEKSLSSNQK